MQSASASIEKENFGKTQDGTPVSLYTLKNSKGMSVQISNYGGIIVSINVPDRNRHIEDIALGFDSLDGYLGSHPYFGAIIGRYANRIGKARFKLEGREYALAVNNGENSLHGGNKGFDKVVWDAKELGSNEGPGISISYLSKDGEENYPGNLRVNVNYILSEQNSLRIEYTATTDKTTVLNLTNHSYFNLAPSSAKDILGHEVTIFADRFTPVDSGLIPTGELRPVAGTPMDFRSPHAIGERIGNDDEQLFLGKGYDHNWIINGQPGTLRPAARVVSKDSGRVLEVHTTEPGMQLYTGNFLDGTVKGKGGKTYPIRSGLCLETQHYPDSPNKPEFPTVTLKPGEIYKSVTVYGFSVQ